MKNPAAVNGPPPASLTFEDALASPCASCPTAPCCTHLPLHTFHLTSLTELDHARYVLNFEGIELGLAASGDWTVYYHGRCRFLNPEGHGCSLHGLPEQPRICVHYNPYHCWYKRAYGEAGASELLRIDRGRMEWIAAQVRFDALRNITTVPDWDQMAEALAEIPLEDNERRTPEWRDPAQTRWATLVATGATEPPGTNLLGFAQLTDPCAACDAPCCTTLVFPHPVPSTAANLDYLAFALGFPGVEVGVADAGWTLAVRTPCRNLRGSRCAVYGTPQRPLICQYYDAWKCSYRTQYGEPRPPGFVRIDRERFPWLIECFRFDASGAVARVLPAEDVRVHVEDRWRRSLRVNGPASDDGECDRG